MNTTRNACVICDCPIGPGFLMCQGHWFFVPIRLQRQIYRTWGQLSAARNAEERQAARPAYEQVRQEAITAVQRRIEQEEPRQ